MRSASFESVSALRLRTIESTVLPTSSSNALPIKDSTTVGFMFDAATNMSRCIFNNSLTLSTSPGRSFNLINDGRFEEKSLVENVVADAVVRFFLLFSIAFSAQYN